jgi:GNAT superfamily N-acetyltransferase
VLADGGLAFVRAARPGDETELAALHARLSRDSNYLRYFTVRRRLPEAELMRAVRADGARSMAFVAYVQGRLAAWAGYVGDGGESAEVAFQVEDEQQGRGLGTLLLELLAAHAHEAGLHRFTAVVLPQNRRMLEVFRDAGFPVHAHHDGGVLDVVLDIDPTRHSRAALDQRHAQALAHARERIAGARRDT